MIKILIGGSPCTHWSIAQSKNRETTAEGIGWELFRNYLIAKEKFQPDFFLYENNKSAAQPIKDQIQVELGHKLVYINSALVSAQNRQRFYVCNWDVEQPKDRGIILRDIIESGMAMNEKSYALTTRCAGTIPSDTFARHRHTMIAKPVRVGTIESDVKKTENDSQQYRVYSPEGKSVALCGNGGGVGAKTGLYAVQIGMRNRREADGKLYRRFETHGGEKANALTTVQTDSMVGIRSDQEEINGKTVYTVKGGQIEIKGRMYQINLADGRYIIRKLTPVECERLQTLPDGYTKAVSNAQRYKSIGNGWTAEVIIHCLQGALKDVDRNERIVVLSMYDGIGTGRYCLDKMGFTNIAYHAYEIDKYAMQVAMSNYPDIIQHGDAFQLRTSDEVRSY